MVPESIILGCTEIMLLIRPDNVMLPLFDTTTLHALATGSRWPWQFLLRRQNGLFLEIIGADVNAGQRVSHSLIRLFRAR